MVNNDDEKLLGNGGHNDNNVTTYEGQRNGGNNRNSDGNSNSRDPLPTNVILMMNNNNTTTTTTDPTNVGTSLVDRSFLQTVPSEEVDFLHNDNDTAAGQVEATSTTSAPPVLQQQQQQPIASNLRTGGLQKPSTIQNRSVSWQPQPPTNNNNTTNNNDSASRISSSTNAPSFKTMSRLSISLRDLSQRSPLESEAETYIMRTIETNDPLKNGPNEAQLTILGNVPLDTVHDFSPDGTSGQSKPPSIVSIDNKITNPTTGITVPKGFKHRRDKSTAENLWDLTEDLAKLQGASNHRPVDNVFGNDNNDGDATVATIENVILMEGRKKIGGGGSSADVLASNATQMLRHRRAQKFLEKHAQQTTPKTAADRWKKVRATIDTSGVAAMATNSEAATASATVPTMGGVVLNSLGSTILASNTSSAKSDSKKDDDDNKKDDIEMGNGGGGGLVQQTETSQSKLQKQQQGLVRTTKIELNQGYHDFENWVKLKKSAIQFHIKLLTFLVTPAIGVAALLFYVFENPPCGTSSECVEKQNTNSTGSELDALIKAPASYSWWILFVCVRHALMLTLAAATKAIVIDFLCIRTRALLSLCGPVVTLFTVQSKGWPFLLTSWAIFSFMFLFGDHPFAKNWLFFQSGIDLFNETNPSGGITSLTAYRNVLILGIAVGIAVAIKRFWVAIIIGRHTFSRYANDLATLMAKVLLVGQVSELARDIESYGYKLADFNLDHELFKQSISKEEDTVDVDSSMDGGSTSPSKPRTFSNADEPFKLGHERVFGMRKDFSGTATKNKINRLLGEWEEPQEIRRSDDKVKISAIIQFRTSLSCLNTTVPFGPAFGNAGTRQESVESTEALFHRLLLATPQRTVLTFDTLAMLAIDDDGNLDEDKIRELIRVFRPDREGTLTLIDFAKSVDAVYKELRLLRASVLNSSRMDRAFESIINVMFYFIMYCIVLSVLGIDPLVLFASVSGFILAFAFMIGAACSKYFEGILFILLRRPYDIGDRINISDPTKDTESTGSSTWFVRDVNLFSSTMCFAATNEVATYSNGSLASCRIINAARSPNAVVQFNLKFPTDISYEKLQVFHKALEEFVKARPREYQSFSGFRCTKIEADLGYVQYIVLASHRESWQNLRSILTSKAELATFALELSKKMNIRYRCPPMPIDLRMSPSTMNSFRGTNDPLSNINQGLLDDGDESIMPDEADIAAVNALFTNK